MLVFEWEGFEFRNDTSLSLHFMSTSNVARVQQEGAKISARSRTPSQFN